MTSIFGIEGPGAVGEAAYPEPYPGPDLGGGKVVTGHPGPDTGHNGPVPVADTILCVDCGGTCHRVPVEPPELGWRSGDVVTYRCVDCVDMWYLEVADEDLGD